MVVITALENGEADTLIDKPLKSGYDMGDGCIRRGRRPRRPVTFVHSYQQVQVIRHNDPALDFSIFKRI